MVTLYDVIYDVINPILLAEKLFNQCFFTIRCVRDCAIIIGKGGLENQKGGIGENHDEREEGGGGGASCKILFISMGALIF